MAENCSIRTRRIWTDSDKRQLAKLYPNMYTEDIGKIINRSTCSVYGQAFIMGLKKSDKFRAMELQKQGDRLRKCGAKSRFSKGHEPANKGKEMAPEVYEKVKGTMFQKGRVSHNTKPLYSERISVDGYVEIKIREGKYVHKHRYVWEQAHGPIPRNMIIAFKDKNPLNITIENLELITRQENMMRNTIQRFPEELKSAIRLVKKLKNAVHEKQN